VDVAVALVLVVTGVIHLLPIVGVRSGPAVARLYGVPDPEPGTELLLRHRAVLLAMVAVVCFAGAADQDVRPLALAVGVVSTAAYVALCRRAATAELHRVAVIDAALLVLLVAAAVAVALG
jgi:hypothetical protein